MQCVKCQQKTFRDIRRAKELPEKSQETIKETHKLAEIPENLFVFVKYCSKCDLIYVKKKLTVSDIGGLELNT